MKKRTRKTLLFILFFVVIFIAYYILRIVFAPKIAVPQEFTDARIESAVIAQDIVNASNDLNGRIGEINELDKLHQNDAALQKIADARQVVSDIRSRAIMLSKDLQIMAAALPNIHSAAASQAALDSISDRIALVGRLITYTDEVNQLLAELQVHFVKGKTTTQATDRLVLEINGEVRAINTFNSQAGQAMDRFDKIVK